MPDALDRYFQCVESAGRWEFQVGVVTWDGPHSPGMVWKHYRRWNRRPDAARLARARAAALTVPRFFRTCTRCGALRNAGHMHDPQTCQSCAERHLGVVH